MNDSNGRPKSVDDDDPIEIDPFERDIDGMIPQEEEATGFLPVPDGEDSYDRLRMPHERDESVDPARRAPRKRGGKRTR